MPSGLKNMLTAVCSFTCPQNHVSFNHFLPVCRVWGRSLILWYLQPPPLAAPTFLLCHWCCVGRQLVCGLPSPSMEWVSTASCVSSTSFCNPPQASHQPKIKPLYLNPHTSFRQTNDLVLLVS